MPSLRPTSLASWAPFMPHWRPIYNPLMPHFCPKYESFLVEPNFYFNILRSQAGKEVQISGMPSLWPTSLASWAPFIWLCGWSGWRSHVPDLSTGRWSYSMDEKNISRYFFAFICHKFYQSENIKHKKQWCEFFTKDAWMVDFDK